MATQQWKDSHKDELRRYRREWYARNREHAKTRVNERKASLKEWFIELKEALKCEKCGQSHVACLQFHHKDPTKKDMSVSKAIANGWGKERIEKEIKKCQVLCSNCHFILHWEENNS